MYVQTKSGKKKASEALAIIAMVLLLIYIADAGVARGNSQGFLPMTAAQRGMIFGTSSILLFILSFAIGFREKSKLTTVLLIVGGALIGTSVLAASIMASGGSTVSQNYIVIVIIIGYIIMGLGILRAVQKK
jgi:hypothetical protein